MTRASQPLAAAVASHQDGDLVRAEQLYRQVLQDNPNHADALHLLGVLAYQAGRAQQALGLIEQAIELYPSGGVFYGNLGTVLESLGRWTEALAAYRRGLNAVGEQVELLFKLAGALRVLRRPAEAETEYRRLLRIQPDHAETHNNLGIVLQQQGNLEASVAAYRHALEIKPDHAGAHNNLGSALQAQGETEEAGACYRRAAELRPDLADAHNNLGTVLQTEGKWAEAREAFQRALQIEPGHAEALVNLAASFERTNRLDEAIETAEKALRVVPNDTRANLVAARCDGRQGRHQQAIDRLLTVRPFIHDATEPAEEIAFELGKLYDRVGDADRAIAEFTEANRMARQLSTRWRPANQEFLRTIKVLRRTFTPEWVQSWSPTPPWMGDVTPVFLVGFPRSGTTLLEVMLDNHPRIQTIDERPVLLFVRAEVERMSGGYPQAMCDLSPGEIGHLRSVYFEAVDRFLGREFGAQLVDKVPLHSIHAGLIVRLFPGAKFIFAARHPCDACLSCFMQNFKVNAAMASFFSLEEAAALYDASMSLWRQYTRLLALDCHLVKYERLVEDFEGEARRLLEFLGVEWDDAVLEHQDGAIRRGRISTPSYHQVASPIYRRARYRWRRYEKHLQPILDTLKPHIRWLGYEDSPDAAVDSAARSQHADASRFPSATGFAGGSHRATVS